MFDGNWERKSIKNMIRKEWSDKEEEDGQEKMVSRTLREEIISRRKRVGQTHPLLHRK